jgi:penicillin G amidase
VGRLYRDAYGVPHVRAADVLDLARTQGYAAARDRTWQLEHQRRRATGTTAEVLGRPQLGWDVLARRTRIAETARRAYAALSPEARAFVAAYVEGVNAGLDDDAPELQQLAIPAQRWEVWTPLAVFHAQHLLFAALPARLWHARARAVLGEEEALLSRDPAYSSGSNAWALGGAVTASGRPLVAGDPHRGFESPNVYAQVRLAVEDEGIDVAGFTFPGVPGVQHFAQATEVAWAITNAAGDYQDVYAESLDDVVDARSETVLVRGGDPVTVEVWATERGPLFELGDGRGLALRNPSTVLGDLGFEALLPLLRARSVDDVDAALEHWVEPVNNVVIADRTGAVRFRNAGRVPVRPPGHRRDIVPGGAHGWAGWLDLPRHDVEDLVVTANERRGPQSDAIGTEFAPPHRAERIRALLEGRRDLTVEDCAAVHDDTVLAGRDWRADSTEAAAYALWRDALARRIAAEPVFDALRDTSGHGEALAAYLRVEDHVGLALDRLLEAERPFGIDVRRLARLAEDDVAGRAPVTWGELHRYAPVHAFDGADPALGLAAPAVPDVPLSGDTDTVRCAGWIPGVGFAAYRGSVARYAWDLADRSRSGWVVPMGASGDPRSPHHLDQLAAWREGRLVPVTTRWEMLREEPA